MAFEVIELNVVLWTFVENETDENSIQIIKNINETFIKTKNEMLQELSANKEKGLELKINATEAIVMQNVGVTDANR